MVLLGLQNKPIFEDVYRQSIIWQLEGAPSNYGFDVKALTKMLFTEWIEKKGTIEWPASFRDLTPCDFGMWEVSKEKVFLVKP